MCHIRLLVAKTHWADEAFVLDGSTSEARTDKGWLRDHALPGLFVGLLSGVNNREHLLLADTLDLGKRDREAGGLLVPLLFDGARKSLCVLLVGTVEQVLGQGLGGGFGGLGSLDVALFAGADLLLHLDLLDSSLLCILLGPQSAQVLGLLTGLVAFSGNALPDTFIVIQPLSVLLGPALHCKKLACWTGCEVRARRCGGHEARMDVLYSF